MYPVGDTREYAGWTKLAAEIDPKYKNFRAQQLSLSDYARLRRQAGDRLMGSKS